MRKLRIVGCEGSFACAPLRRLGGMVEFAARIQTQAEESRNVLGGKISVPRFKGNSDVYSWAEAVKGRYLSVETFL